MIEIKDNIYYQDYEKSLELLRSIDYSKYNYPDEITNFHIYSEIKTEKELLCVKSWIATQNLEKCRLNIWSDYNIENNELLKPYLKYVSLRVYDPIKEAKGTILESSPSYLAANDSLHWLKSDLFRILITNKYGGVFADMDLVFLNDLKPILDQEFIYQWGSETDFTNQGACATVLRTFKNSEFSNYLIRELIGTPIMPGSTNWGKELLGKVYSKYKKFTIFPATFFDTEWQINVKFKGLGDKIESGWFIKNEWSGILFLEAFGWHWHNSSNKNKSYEKGSKFDLLTHYIDNKLNKKINELGRMGQFNNAEI